MMDREDVQRIHHGLLTLKTYLRVITRNIKSKVAFCNANAVPKAHINVPPSNI